MKRVLLTDNQVSYLSGYLGASVSSLNLHATDPHVRNHANKLNEILGALKDAEDDDNDEREWDGCSGC
jgi:hypothetical protein